MEGSIGLSGKHRNTLLNSSKVIKTNCRERGNRKANEHKAEVRAIGPSGYSDGKVMSEYEKYGLSKALSKVINRGRISDSESRLYVFSQNGDIITTL